jgi:hypothetical protein
VGDQPLPALYFLFSAIFFASFGVWLFHLRKNSAHIHHIHMLMTGVVVVKALSLLFHAVAWLFLNNHGHSGGWNIVYYIFAFLKGMSLFAVILLIGTGWSMLKPFLNDKEKKVVLVVLTLQVLDNVALIVLDEMAPGSRSYLAWGVVLHAVDLACCVGIVVPLVWSIRHLREAQSADGKGAETAHRLAQFNRFYLVIIAYLYFTRIIVYIFSTSMGYRYSWFAPFMAEAATLTLFIYTGLKFRPTSDNPYLRVAVVDSDDEDDAEFGLGEEGAP